MKERKKNINIDVQNELQKKISNNNIVKYAIYSFSIVGGILAVGFFAKIFNYTIKNVKQLKNTLKQ